MLVYNVIIITRCYSFFHCNKFKTQLYIQIHISTTKTFNFHLGLLNIIILVFWCIKVNINYTFALKKNSNIYSQLQ